MDNLDRPVTHKDLAMEKQEAIIKKQQILIDSLEKEIQTLKIFQEENKKLSNKVTELTEERTTAQNEVLQLKQEIENSFTTGKETDVIEETLEEKTENYKAACKAWNEKRKEDDPYYYLPAFHSLSMKNFPKPKRIDFGLEPSFWE
jgi:hypothetical protein